VRIPATRSSHRLGRPERPRLPWARAHERSLLSFPDAPGGPLRIAVTPLVECYVGIGTGYGFDADWRHGMYQGPLVVQGPPTPRRTPALWGLCDAVARFESGGQGYGLFEYGLFGPFLHYGFKEFPEAP
jgi:hypothetical protein